MNAIDEYVSHLRLIRRRPRTVYQRRRSLVRLENFCGKPVLLCDVSELREFVSRPGLGPEGQNLETSSLRSFYRWAREESLIEVDPTVRLHRPARAPRLPRPMPDRDARRALMLAEDPVRTWLMLAFYAGLRCCEIAQLRGEDISPTTIIIRDSKGGGMTSVPVGAPLEGIAERLGRMNGWCWPTDNPRSKLPHVAAARVSSLTNQFLRSVGITHTAHSARHWFGSQAYRTTGRDLRATQELMRHRSPVSTAGYTYVDPGEIALALDALPRLTA